MGDERACRFLFPLAVVEGDPFVDLWSVGSRIHFFFGCTVNMKIDWRNPREKRGQNPHERRKAGFPLHVTAVNGCPR